MIVAESGAIASIICEQLETGLVEELNDPEVAPEVTHYLPHHPSG